MSYIFQEVREEPRGVCFFSYTAKSCFYIKMFLRFINQHKDCNGAGSCSAGVWSSKSSLSNATLRAGPSESTAIKTRVMQWTSTLRCQTTPNIYLGCSVNMERRRAGMKLLPLPMHVSRYLPNSLYSSGACKYFCAAISSHAET